MDVKEIGEALVAHCNSGSEREALKTLYAENAVSVEPTPMEEGGSAVTEGLAGINGKHDWWDNAMETHSFNADGPYPHGDDRFAVIFEADVTDKEKDQRFQFKEIAVYTVADGKIVKEEFFFSM
ncbi:MAG: nuclear transport factor 2 family protein [Pseudomonadota bacterium]